MRALPRAVRAARRVAREGRGAAAGAGGGADVARVSWSARCTARPTALSTAGRHVGDSASGGAGARDRRGGPGQAARDGRVLRVADPTPLAGLRPGAAAAAIAGCLAIGGGATYCAEQGVNPIRGRDRFRVARARTQAARRPAASIDARAQRHSRRPRRRRHRRPRRPSRRRRRRSRNPQRRQRRRRRRSRRAATRPRHRRPQAEYEPIGQSASAAPAPPSTSAAAPTQGPRRLRRAVRGSSTAHEPHHPTGGKSCL